MMQINSNKFRHIGINERSSQTIVRPSMTYWRDALRRLKRNKVAMTGLFIIIVFTVMSIVGPMMAKFSYDANDLSITNKLPDAEHWFGTDKLGRDLWARVWMGARISLFIGFIAAFLNSVIGVVVGGVSGYFGGKIDMVIMRVIDVLITIPDMIYTILIMVMIGSGVLPIILALTITGWLGMARLVRGQVLQLKEQEFILAAKVLGASSGRIIFRHLIPNTLGVVIVNLTMRIPGAIFSEAFLSFIGLGVKPPMASWGQLASLGNEVFQTFPYQLFIPAFFISLTMLALNLLGDGLRDALDPRLRR